MSNSNGLDNILYIIKDDKCMYKKGFGYADIKSEKEVTADNLFEIGSASKAFTALAILKLQKDKLINLDDPVEQYMY